MARIKSSNSITYHRKKEAEFRKNGWEGNTEQVWGKMCAWVHYRNETLE